MGRSVCIYQTNACPVPTKRFQPEELLNRSSLTEEELRLLLQYLQQPDSRALRNLLLEKFADDISAAGSVELPGELSAKMLENIRLATAPVQETAPRRFWRPASIAAAAVLILLASAVFWFLRPVKQPEPVLSAVQNQGSDVAAPSGSRATITLANGQQIVIDSNQSGTLAIEGAVQIERAADGAIAYRGSATETVYNTLFNPRGSKPVSLTLSDGSKVWLNSESSLRYPVGFNGKTRPVEITGEAYFEVAKNPAMPFRVSVAGKGTVEVLGTHFNINSYGDETHTQVTLLEGSVRVELPESQPVVIQPGQQAFYASGLQRGAGISVKNGVDLAAVMAWKNGYFNFDNADLYQVMRQLARWYNIQVKYEGKIPHRVFGGEMQRDLNLSEVLKLLEKNNVHFRIENNQLFVRP